MPTLWEILDREDQKRMDLHSQLCRYEEAVLPLRRYDKGLLLQGCNVLQGISPTTFTIALVIRNLMTIVYPNDEGVKEEVKRAEVTQGYLEKAKDDPATMKAAAEEANLAKTFMPRAENYKYRITCMDCGKTQETKHRKGRCSYCKSEDIKRVKLSGDKGH